MTKTHLIKTDEVEDGVKLACSCGWSGKATDHKYVRSITSRHLLNEREWPFEEVTEVPEDFTKANLVIQKEDE